MKNYLKNKFLETYKIEPELYLSCGGRFEVLGNHTDHNHGLCIAATCSLSIFAAIKARNDLLVNVYSREQLCYVVHFYEMAIFGLVHRREGKRKL
jgi:galactokinase